MERALFYIIFAHKTKKNFWLCIALLIHLYQIHDTGAWSEDISRISFNLNAWKIIY